MGFSIILGLLDAFCHRRLLDCHPCKDVYIFTSCRLSPTSPFPPPPRTHTQSLTIEEVKARQERLAKMRSLLFHHELKAKRLKAIKSKDYRKRVAKVSALMMHCQDRCWF